MEELNVVGNLIQSDIIDVQRIDAMISNRSFEDTTEELIDLGIEEQTVDKIDFFSHLHSDYVADVAGIYNGKHVGIEAKGIAPSKKRSQSNFKYWAKGIQNQMFEIQDCGDFDAIGIAIPKDVKNLLRGILSSKYDRISDTMVQRLDAENLYGTRNAEKLRIFNNDDLIFTVSTNSVMVWDAPTFFGVNGTV